MMLFLLFSNITRFDKLWLKLPYHVGISFNMQMGERLIFINISITFIFNSPNQENLENTLLILSFQRLAGATLLVFANKQDLPGALSSDEIRQVSVRWSL